ncbi:hypothetical protein E3U43_011032 [Larimichthys crocea]|uniref:Uncharacterized protein n=1 Tax=Larimichthys crocea TaxID=215358 RepID=A0ACD3RIC3_LARCR|nr:hypothetical protein E3U43_011032 [Larimichthys crocea]
MQYSASRYQMWLLTLHCRSNNSDLARNHYVHLTEKSRKKVRWPKEGETASNKRKHSEDRAENIPFQRSRPGFLPGTQNFVPVLANTGSCVVSVYAWTSGSEAQRGGEDVGMLTSASQRFNWETSVVRLTNNGLSNLEETPRHVTCCQEACVL